MVTGERSETKILIGILLFSMLSILLALVDAIIERGGVIKTCGVEIGGGTFLKGKRTPKDLWNKTCRIKTIERHVECQI